MFSPFVSILMNNAFGFIHLLWFTFYLTYLFLLPTLLFLPFKKLMSLFFFFFFSFSFLFPLISLEGSYLCPFSGYQGYLYVQTKLYSWKLANTRRNLEGLAPASPPPTVPAAGTRGLVLACLPSSPHIHTHMNWAFLLPFYK